MGYRTAARNPIFGNAMSDLSVESTPGSAWRGTKCYRNLTIGDGANDVVVKADGTRWGPLIVRCSGTLRIRNRGLLAADACAEQLYPGTGGTPYWVRNGGFYHATQLFQPNGGLGQLGGGQAFGGSYSFPLGHQLAVLPVPGGAGGSGVGGGECGGYMRMAPKYGQLAHGWPLFFQGIYSDSVCQSPGGGSDGESGDTCLAGADTPQDVCVPELGQYAVGCGGGAGFGVSAGNGEGGDGGGVLAVYARRVIVEAGGRVSANGDDGQDGQSGNYGGGAGGGGGTVFILCEKYVNEGTVQAQGGTGGAEGQTTAGNGGDGVSGVVRVLEGVA